MKLTYNELEFIGIYGWIHGIYEVREIIYSLNSILPENLKIDNKAKDITMETMMSIDTNENVKLWWKIFFIHY